MLLDINYNSLLVIGELSSLLTGTA